MRTTVHQALCASLVSGLALIAGPGLAQSSPPTPPSPNPSTPPATPRPSTPRPSTPRPSAPPDRATPPGSTTPGERTQTGATGREALDALEGNWTVTIRTMGAGGSQLENEIQGTSRRNWILNDRIMQEEVKAGDMSSITGDDPNQVPLDSDRFRPGGPQDAQRDQSPRPQARPGQQIREGSAMSGQFEGHGMFGFDEDSGQFIHVWVDNHDSEIVTSVGTYDPQTRTFTFVKQEMEGSMMPGASPARPSMPPPATPRPGATPGSDPDSPRTSPPGSNRPGATPPGANPDRGTTPPGQGRPQPISFDQTTPDLTPSRPGTTPQDRQPSARPTTPPATPPSTQRPGAAQLMGKPRVVLRVISDNQQVVEYFRPGAGGQDQKFMEIQYVKSR